MENNTSKKPNYIELLEKAYKEAVEGIKAHGFTFGETFHFSIPNAEEELPIASKAIGIDLINTKLVQEVINYLKNNNRKHLLLLGSVGTGKTLLATKIIPLLIFSNFKKIFKIYKACDLSDNLSDAKKYPFIVVDDFGTESTAVNFGNKIEALSEWVDSLEGRACLAIATTNLDANQIKQRYGVRTYDRLRGLFKVIQVNEKSLRG